MMAFFVASATLLLLATASDAVSVSNPSPKNGININILYTYTQNDTLPTAQINTLLQDTTTTSIHSFLFDHSIPINCTQTKFHSISIISTSKTADVNCTLYNFCTSLETLFTQLSTDTAALSIDLQTSIDSTIDAENITLTASTLSVLVLTIDDDASGAVDDITTTLATTASLGDTRNDSKTSTGAIAGAVLGSIFGVLLIIAVVAFILYKLGHCDKVVAAIEERRMKTGTNTDGDEAEEEDDDDNDDRNNHTVDIQAGNINSEELYEVHTTPMGNYQTPQGGDFGAGQSNNYSTDFRKAETEDAELYQPVSTAGGGDEDLLQHGYATPQQHVQQRSNVQTTTPDGLNLVQSDDNDEDEEDDDEKDLEVVMVTPMDIGSAQSQGDTVTAGGATQGQEEQEPEHMKVPNRMPTEIPDLPDSFMESNMDAGGGALGGGQEYDDDDLAASF